MGGLKMLAVRSGKVVRDIPWRPWAARIQAGRACSEFLAGLGGPGGQRAAPKAGRKGSTRRAICYAQCVLGAQNVRENITYFERQQKEHMLFPNRDAKYVKHSNVS